MMKHFGCILWLFIWYAVVPNARCKCHQPSYLLSIGEFSRIFLEFLYQLTPTSHRKFTKQLVVKVMCSLMQVTLKISGRFKNFCCKYYRRDWLKQFEQQKCL